MNKTCLLCLQILVMKIWQQNCLQTQAITWCNFRPNRQKFPHSPSGTTASPKCLNPVATTPIWVRTTNSHPTKIGPQISEKIKKKKKKKKGFACQSWPKATTKTRSRKLNPVRVQVSVKKASNAVTRRNGQTSHFGWFFGHKLVTNRHRANIAGTPYRANAARNATTQSSLLSTRWATAPLTG